MTNLVTRTAGPMLGGNPNAFPGRQHSIGPAVSVAQGCRTHATESARAMNVDPDFLDHWRTRLLVELLDNDEMAPIYVLRLWAYCQTRRQTHIGSTPPNLPQQNPNETQALKGICRYLGDGEKFALALLQSGYIAKNGEMGYEVTKFREYNAQLFANWENGKKGGRPKKPIQNPFPEWVTNGKPIHNPLETQTENPVCAHNYSLIDPHAHANGGQHTGSYIDTDTHTRTDVKKTGNLSAKTVGFEKKRVSCCVHPTVEMVAEYCQERANGIDPQRFVDYYTANGWRVGRNPMKDWKAAVRTWERKEAKPISRVATQEDAKNWVP